MTTANLVEITPLAAERLEAVLKEQDAEGSLLRIMVTPSAHGGVQYMLGVEQEAADGDVVIDAENIKVLVDAESAPLVDGAEIDYVDGLMRSGFVISNPNVQSGGGGCACGGGGCGGGGGEGCVAAAAVEAAAAPAAATRAGPKAKDFGRGRVRLVPSSFSGRRRVPLESGRAGGSRSERVGQIALSRIRSAP